MVNQSIFSGGVRIRSLNGYLIAVNGEVFATTNTGGTTNAFFYQAKTTITSGDPGSGHLIWNNATQISATQLNVSHLTDTPVEDIDLFLSAIASGNKLVVQDRNDSANYQSWTVTGTPTQIGSSYWTIPVSLFESQGTGTTGFANNHDLLFAIISGGTGGGGITTNSITFNNSGSGAASGTSFNGGTAVTISYNTIGAQQASASLTALAGLTYASGTPFVKMTGAGTFALDTNTYITGNQTITLSGDVTGSGATAITTTIANNAVTLAKMAQVATARFLGRVTAGTGNVEALTGTQATTLLDTFTSALKGLAPASGGGTTNFLRADGTWAAPPGGSGTPAGSNTQIQYNNSGAFGASANLTYDGSSLSVIGNGVLAKFDGTGTNDSYIDIQRGGTTQWRLGNNYNGGTKAFQIRDQVNNRNDFTINNSGQIGIGLNSVTSFLGSNSTSEVHDITGLKGFTRFVNYRAAGGNTNGNAFENYLTRTLTPGSFGATISGDQLMSYFAYGSSASNWIYGGSFKYDQNGATSSFVPGIWTFGASSGSTQDITTFRVDGGNDRIQFNTNSTERVRITSSGRVLMGSTLPTDNGVDALQVSGSAIATRLKVNTSGQTLEINNYYAGGTGRNIWIGGGGASSTSAAWGNLAVGDGAMSATTSGFFNTAIGASALQSLTSGDRNMALGFEAGPGITSGRQNTAMGANALGNLSTGSDNTGVGAGSLGNITTPSSNIGIGAQSGVYFAPGVGSNNTTSSQSIYIGNDTRSSANGNTNEMVFGHNAIGQGSNSVTLGNSSITRTFLRGNTMVNTTTDNGVDRLQVNGSAIATRLKVNTSGQTLEINNYYNTGSGNNIWIGNGGASSTSGYNNVAIGGNALLSVTSGFLNTAVGASALQSLTSGSGNMAFGFESLPLLTTGTANTAIGPNALGSSTTGSDNTGIGNASLIFLTTTSSNVGIGRDAGRFISGGSILTTPTQSVFIGNDTRASANGNTNEIVIGHGAIGQGSNSVTLGNSSITQTLLRGTVTAGSYVKSGGTNSQVLYADGSTKQITSGTAAPTGGSDGDIYLQYDVSLLTGSGTANYIPKFTSSTAIGNSQIFDNGTNVGIGTTSPVGRLHLLGAGTEMRVESNTTTDGFIRYINTSGSMSFGMSGAPTNTMLLYDRTNNHNAYEYLGGASGRHVWYTANAERMRITSGGDVGIGTASPAHKLDVNGIARVTTEIRSKNTVSNVSYFTFEENANTNSATFISGDARTTGSIGLWTNSLERMRITSGGNALIGTTTDNGTDRLQVSGSVQATQYSATVQTLTDGATITFDAANGSNAVVTLGGNRTLAFSNTRTGAYYTLRVIQDGTGSRTLTMPGTVKVIGGGGGVVNLTTTANAVDIISFYFDGTTYWASFGQNYT